ncbi:hypothetical protein B0H16DRAFT_1742800 [Mycena metata]|uniref:F-box domain-containing protein n=1 Tax=Mycena metata TaxID=1033252 RepID=A0AAD7H7E5_9AGAR|nr:hypothetical protein B0H16DRAFT_1742800 [Mycena metata]
MSSRSPLRRTLHSFTTKAVNKLNSLFPPKSNAYSPYGQERSRWRAPPTRVHFIHRLPAELIACFFVLGAEDDEHFAIRVSQVCRTWRSIALHTPSLWRRISLGPQQQMWRERIYRAKAVLDIHTVQLCMHLVAPFVRRWRSLTIYLSDYEPFLANAALSGCCHDLVKRRGRAPLLEELTVVYRANDDTKEFCLFSGCTPKLRRLTVDGLRLTWLPSLFQNLTFLDYTHHGFSAGDDAVAELLYMLSVCKRLQELKILFPRKSMARPPGPFRPDMRRVVLPWLLQLHLRVETRDIPPELARLVTHLSTPALTSLYLTDPGRRRHPFPNLTSFMRAYPMLPSLQTVFVEHGWHGPFVPRRRG